MYEPIKPKQKRAKPEDFYNKLIAERIGAAPEVRLENGLRVDMETGTHVYEVDFGGHKIYEGIGQALCYAYFTGKLPGLIILIRDQKEQSLMDILEEAVLHYDIELRVYTITDKYTGEFEQQTTQTVPKATP